jgi:hypothetical protein
MRQIYKEEYYLQNGFWDYKGDFEKQVLIIRELYLKIVENSSILMFFGGKMLKLG